MTGVSPGPLVGVTLWGVTYRAIVVHTVTSLVVGMVALSLFA